MYNHDVQDRNKDLPINTSRRHRTSINLKDCCNKSQHKFHRYLKEGRLEDTAPIQLAKLLQTKSFIMLTYDESLLI